MGKYNSLKKYTAILMLSGAFILSCCPLSSMAQPRKQKRPALIVRVVVEQMRYEMLLRYWENFEEDGGFKKVVNNGLNCQNTKLSYALTESAPGFATLATGSVPAEHGIISDDWYNRLSDEIEFSVSDDSYSGIDGIDINKKEGYSPQKLFTTTLGDEMKMVNSKSKIFSVSLNPVSAVFGNGRLSDGAFWFNDNSGNWMTSTYYMDSLSPWIQDFNERKLQEIYMKKTWNKLLQDEKYINSMPDENDAEKGFTLIGENSFPYDLSSLKDRSYSFKYLKYTPFGNTYTKDFVLSLIENENLGQDENTDLLSISLASSSYINELFGSRSKEMEDLFYRLDKDLEHLVDFLEEKVGKENFLLVLTSDKGSVDMPEYRKLQKLQTKTFKPRATISLLNSYLNIIYEENPWVKSYYNRQLYLDHGLIDQKGYDIDRFQERIARFLEKKSGVLYAVRASSLKESYFGNRVKNKIQKSYHPKRSGDIFLSFEPGTVEYPDNSGSGYNYDSHVPLIWYGMELQSGVVSENVSLEHITPTISTIFNFPLPEAAGNDGIKGVIDAFK
ncbi:MAG: alkaline phosphatase family protein [Bacteroidales bacterium]